MLTIVAKINGEARGLLRACLASAFRTALACSIVGVVTLYGPAAFRSQIAFPAFSYVTVILVVTDATLGDTLRGCWHALYASIQSLVPAMLCLYLIGPGRLSNSSTSLAVALAALAVALPAEKTHLIAKRIALGQIVIVYVTGYVNGVNTEPVMHPLHVAASTAIGVLACVVALLIPYPRLACQEVRRNSELLAQNTLERLQLLVKAFCAEDKKTAKASISTAASLASARTKLLQTIQRYQDAMEWEIFPIKIFRRQIDENPGDRLQNLDTTLRGMEMALSNIHSFPVGTLSKELKCGLNKIEQHISQTLNQAISTLHYDSLTIPEPSAESLVKCIQSLDTIPQSHQDLPIYFFFFCMKLMHQKYLATTSTSVQSPPQKNSDCSISKQKVNSLKDSWNNCKLLPKIKRHMPAFRCSISLGLAIIFGLTYSKPNGIWSGLPVAISLATAREATFRVANAKAQGTVLGTVYGVLGCFVFEKFLPIRFLSLLPWFLFSSFLQRSKMYGPAGGISAVIGAVLILGRKGFGAPSQFAITRIVETFIGLSCSILVDLLLQPTRGSTLAKHQLTRSLAKLKDYMGSVSLFAMKPDLEEKRKALELQVDELKKYIAEAEVEPSFWFLPFQSACYRKLLQSLTKMMDLLVFVEQSLSFLQHESQIGGAPMKNFLKVLEEDIGDLKEMLCSSISSFEKISRVKSLAALEKEFQEKSKISCDCDVESGKSSSKSNICMIFSLDSEAEVEKEMRSYLQHAREVVDKVHGVEDEQEAKISQVVLSLASLGFCLSSIMRETSTMQEAMEQLVQRENPASHIDLYEISCKLHALNK